VSASAPIPRAAGVTCTRTSEKSAPKQCSARSRIAGASGVPGPSARSLACRTSGRRAGCAANADRGAPRACKTGVVIHAPIAGGRSGAGISSGRGACARQSLPGFDGTTAAPCPAPANGSTRKQPCNTSPGVDLFIGVPSGPGPAASPPAGLAERCARRFAASTLGTMISPPARRSNFLPAGISPHDSARCVIRGPGGVHGVFDPRAPIQRGSGSVGVRAATAVLVRTIVCTREAAPARSCAAREVTVSVVAARTPW